MNKEEFKPPKVAVSLRRGSHFLFYYDHITLLKIDPMNNKSNLQSQSIKWQFKAC